MRVHVDRSAVTFLAMCECGWRGLPTQTHDEALVQARHHELRAHTGERHALEALNKHRARHAE